MIETNKTVPKRALDLIVFDFDGVLTNNRVYVLDDGREAVQCNRADGLAFDLLRRTGPAVWILSTEANRVVEARAKKLRVPVEHGVGDKAEQLRRLCIEHGYDLGRTMYVGNDLNDLAAMQMVRYPIAVADAHEAVRKIAWCVLVTRGGDGVAREIVESKIVFEGFANGAAAIGALSNGQLGGRTR